MANRELGEDAITIDGTTYTLVLTTNALCELEDAMSTTLRMVTFGDVLIAVKRGSTRAMRSMFWAMLRHHHKAVTLDEAGRLMDRAGGSVNFAEKMAALAFRSMPADDDLKALGIEAKKDRPPKARKRGTGKHSNASAGSRA